MTRTMSNQLDDIFKNSGDPLESLPDISDEDNPIVWCERCKKHHKYWTFTRNDFDNLIADQAFKLAEMIDAEIEEKVFGTSNE